MNRFCIVFLCCMAPISGQIRDINGVILHGLPSVRLAASASRSIVVAAAGYTLDSVRALSEINVSGSADAYPFLSGDGLRVYYDRSNTEYLATRSRRDTLFGPPVPVPGLGDYTDAYGCWLTDNELTIFFVNSATLYRATRSSLSDIFGAAQPVTLTGGPTSFISDPSLTPDLGELYLYGSDSGTEIARYTRVSDLSYTFAGNVTQFDGKKRVGGTSPGQLSKDGLKFLTGVPSLGSSGYNSLCIYSRASIGAPWDTGTEVTTSGLVDSYQPTISADGKTVCFVGNSGAESWSANDLYTARLSMPEELKLIPVPSPTYNLRPLLAWFKVKDAASYTLQVDTTPGFLSPLFSLPLLDTSYTPQTSLSAGAVYWRVKADNTMWSTGSFVIIDARVPLLVPYEPKVTREHRPILRWHPVTGAGGYQIMIDDDRLFSTPVIAASTTDTFYTGATDLPAAVIYWKVKSDLAAAYSAVDTFQIVADTVPFIIRFNGAALPGKRPLFKWYKVPAAVSYIVQVSLNSSWTNLYLLAPVSDTAYSPTVDMVPGKYYWRVSSSRNTIYSFPADSFIIAAGSGIAGENLKPPAAANRTWYLAQQDGKCVLHFAATGAASVVSLYTLSGGLVWKTALAAGARSWTVPSDGRLGPGTYLAVRETGGKIFRQRVTLAP